jgi:hypothetical protein
MKKVRINAGAFRLRGVDVDMSGQIFPLIRDYRVGIHGGFVTVDSTEISGLPNRNIKIFVDGPHSYTEVGADYEPQADAPVSLVSIPEETDREIMDRMRQRFRILDDMTRAIKRGDVKAMILSGPPGVGKSHGVEAALHEHMAGPHNNGAAKVEVVKGAISSLGLYCKLYEYRERDNVLIFDDCDSVFDDPLTLNILKAALDSKECRRISWNTDSHKLRLEDIPNSFEFRGAVIFITNIKLDMIRSAKLRDHIEALESRCHYVDLGISTDREKMLRIKQVVTDGMLDAYRFNRETVDDILGFVNDNQHRLRELSLRTICKTADLAKAFPNSWQDMAQHTLMRR